MELQSIDISEIEPIFRIAHLSDTHISPEYNRYNIVKLKSLLAYIIDENYDHVVITGDIAGHGEERDFRSTRRLLKHFGLLDYEKLSVTIGNHNIFGGVHRAEDLLSFGKHCRSVNYREQVGLFEKTFRETFSKKAYEGQKLFPFVKIVGPTAIVGINSIRKFHPLLNPVGSNGHVSDRQLDSVKQILNHPSVAGLKKIVLIHHHFSKYRPYSESFGARAYHAFESHTLKLHGKRNVEDTFRRCGVDVVLHGHTHIEEIYSRSGILFSSTALDTIGSKSEAEDFLRKDEAGFNEIRISGNGGMEIRRCRVETFRRSRAPGEKVYEE